MKLSVVLPTYNRIDMLLHSLRAVCGIAHRPLEVIVVDDGSRDGTAERCAEMQAICESAGAEFKFIRQSNSGAATARNTGCDHATGELIQWVDSDDTVRPEGVDTLIEALKDDPQLEVAYGLVLVVDADGKGTQTMGKAPEGWETDYFDYLWHTMAAVYRRPALAKVGRWNPRLTMPDDWEFSSRVRIAGCRYRFLDVVVGNYVQHGINTLTTTKFDAAKCYNAVEATLSLREAFIKAGKYTRFIQQRCFNRVFVHALELASKNSDLAKDAFADCRAIGSPNLCLKTLCALVTLLPSCVVHRELFLLLRRDTDGKLRSMLQSSSGQTSSPPAQKVDPDDACEHAPEGVAGAETNSSSFFGQTSISQSTGTQLPKLSVVIPTYDRFDMLLRCVQSVCGVRHRPLEVIVVDDGSSDGTAEKSFRIRTICEAAGVDFKFLRQKNAGASAARNTGWEHATGELIQWVDSDDVVKADGVDTIIAALKDDPRLDVAYGLVVIVDEDGRGTETMGKAPNGSEDDNFDLLWHTMAAVYRRSGIDKVGPWSHGLSLGDDWEFSSRVRIAGCRYRFVDVVVGNYTQHGINTLTTTKFDEAKCLSVINATLSLRDSFMKAGKYTRRIQQRCFNRVFVHALELASTKSDSSPTAFAQCRTIGSPHYGLKLMSLLLGMLPPCFAHRKAFLILRRDRGGELARMLKSSSEQTSSAPLQNKDPIIYNAASLCGPLAENRSSGAQALGASQMRVSDGLGCVDNSSDANSMKAKTVGIISLYEWLGQWDNYGTLLQNFALQRILGQLGIQAFWIRTRSARSNALKRAHNVVLQLLLSPRDLLLLLANLSKGASSSSRADLDLFNKLHPRRFSEFMQAHMNFSAAEYDPHSLRQNAPEADAYIVGSDNVWARVTEASFLDFGPADSVRIAYAVSAPWTKLSRYWKYQARKSVGRIQFLSVREPEGLATCRELGREDAVQLVDPTLLISADEWRKFSFGEATRSRTERDFMFGYFLNLAALDDVPWDAINQTASNMSLDLLVVPLQGAELLIPEKNVYTPSPGEWLDALDNSACVVTNSYHGAIFAIIFHKPFIVIPQSKKQDRGGERIPNLLRMTGLTDRFFHGSSTDELHAQMLSPIDWSQVESALEKERHRGIEFLARSLSAA